MLYKVVALALAALLGAPLTATAIPITYQIKFTALTGSVTTSTYPDPLGSPTNQAEDAAGKVYFGLFAVDDEVLSTDGIGKPGNLDFFYIQMEDNIWGYNSAADNSFVGFRGPDPANPFCTSTSCLFAPSPGFDVVNGTITNLRGGVFGFADIPFVDFSPLGGLNTFAASGHPFIEPGGTSTYVSNIVGTMEILPVTEPDTVLLSGLGLLMLAFMIRRRRRQR
jgi:hypothetical protein